LLVNASAWGPEEKLLDPTDKRCRLNWFRVVRALHETYGGSFCTRKKVQSIFFDRLLRIDYNYDPLFYFYGLNGTMVSLKYADGCKKSPTKTNPGKVLKQFEASMFNEAGELIHSFSGEHESELSSNLITTFRKFRSEDTLFRKVLKTETDFAVRWDAHKGSAQARWCPSSLIALRTILGNMHHRKQKFPSLIEGNEQYGLPDLVKWYKTKFPGIDVKSQEFTRLSAVFGVDIRKNFDVSDLRPQNNEALMQLLLVEGAQEDRDVTSP
jgi:hypothetical protein